MLLLNGEFKLRVLWDGGWQCRWIENELIDDEGVDLVKEILNGELDFLFTRFNDCELGFWQGGVKQDPAIHARLRARRLDELLLEDECVDFINTSVLARGRDTLNLTESHLLELTEDSGDSREGSHTECIGQLWVIEEGLELLLGVSSLLLLSGGSLRLIGILPIMVEQDGLLVGIVEGEGSICAFGVAVDLLELEELLVDEELDSEAVKVDAVLFIHEGVGLLGELLRAKSCKLADVLEVGDT
jgi:hypothetical protein